MGLFNRLKKYRFEIRHFIILFIILAAFQVFLSYLHNISSNTLIEQTMDLYRRDSAIRLGNLATTSLELLLEQSLAYPLKTEDSRRNTIQAFDIILNQQTLQQNVDEMCIIFSSGGQNFVIDDGSALYDFIFTQREPLYRNSLAHRVAVDYFKDFNKEIRDSEQIYCIWDNIQSFHVLVPFVPKGEYEGVVYMRITPDVSNITREISTVYDETGIIFTALILFGLLAMFYITSYTVRERDLAQKELFKERERQIKADIAHQKEELFTKRIYHAHHKAEKVMGFIKDEIRNLSDKNINDFKYIVTRYSNFISRVIYDMKWYDPPVHATRNPIFSTNINDVIRFLVTYVFKRVYSENTAYDFRLELDEKMPVVQINEYVVWEILEPLIQNCIDHNKGQEVLITIRTCYSPAKSMSEINIIDNGKGIVPALLQVNQNGVKEIFLERSSTHENAKNSGYGCYIAYALSTKRCGWQIDAENLESGGSKITIQIPLN
ncbi:MAG TPA: ATP-binding protein [Candidatus Marinimicrobia bacterium]|nr:ATP-binding protein [Candidatus Neomarinimicrobiota bacterium]